MPDRSPPRLITLVLMSAAAMLSLNMFLPALPSMARDLGARESVMALAVSGYMLVSAVFQIVLGPISDRLGRRTVILVALGLFALASLGCLLAQDVTTFLAFRLAQAVIIAGSVVPNAVIRDQFAAREAAARMGALGVAMALAPMVGPVLGGVLDTAVGWRSIFLLFTLGGAAILVWVWFDMGETRKPGPTRLRAADYGALLRARRFWAYVVCVAFSVGSFYIFITGVPYVAVRLWGLSPALIGLGIGSITLGFMIGAAITARQVTRLGLGRLILAGRVIPTIGLAAGVAAFMAGFSHPLLLFGVTTTVGLGNGLTVANANSGAMSVRPDLAGTAAGLSGALVVSTGAALTFVTALAMEWRATPLVLLVGMLASVLVSLAAGLVARRLERDA